MVKANRDHSNTRLFGLNWLNWRDGVVSKLKVTGLCKKSVLLGLGYNVLSSFTSCEMFASSERKTTHRYTWGFLSSFPNWKLMLRNYIYIFFFDAPKCEIGVVTARWLMPLRAVITFITKSSALYNGTNCFPSSLLDVDITSEQATVLSFCFYVTETIVFPRLLSTSKRRI